MDFNKKKICSKCGLELPDDVKFCTFCGEPTDRSTIPQIQPTQPTQPPPTPTPHVGNSFSTTNTSNATGGIIAAICTIFIVGILLIFFGTNVINFIPSTGITILVIGVIVILCIGGSVCGSGRRRRGYGGCGGGGGGSDCGDCDCCDCGDCGGCDCGGCDC